MLLEDEAGNKATAYPLGREPWKVYEALLIEHAKKCIGTADKHGAIIIPAHLRGFAESQIPKWAQSALMAQILQEDVDYIVRAHTTGARKKGDREEKFSNSSVIAPVDNTNTGIVQDNMHFSSGSQQFLQLKLVFKSGTNPARGPVQYPEALNSGPGLIQPRACTWDGEEHTLTIFLSIFRLLSSK